ncbi:MAG: DedA family protein [Anaplasmataceae bacterium]|nr:DedA family protein [Anaplasmataceae bacterium]
MFGYDLESLLLAFSYGAVFILMITNGFITLPSSQLLYIIAGYFVAQGSLNLWLTAFIGALGNTFGTILLYELARRKGLAAIYKLKLFPQEEVRKVIKVFEKKGSWFAFVGKLIPALKVFVPIPAGLSKMNRGLFFFLMCTSSFVWAVFFLYLGAIFGKSTDFLGRYSLILLAIAFLVVIIFRREMNKLPSTESN